MDFEVSMNMQFPPESFDEWAGSYDAETQRASGYPFEGYEDLLKTIVAFCHPQPGESVLDLGCGTGNLSAHFLLFGCQVSGIDFSKAMINIARQKYPAIDFRVQDVRAVGVSQYDHIVSAYVFHHFPIKEKVRIIQGLLRQNLKAGGKLVIGDLVFTDQAARTDTGVKYAQDWDEEYFWMEEVDLPQMRAAGLNVKIERVSFCAAVMKIEEVRE